MIFHGGFGEDFLWGGARHSHDKVCEHGWNGVPLGNNSGEDFVLATGH